MQIYKFSAVLYCGFLVDDADTRRIKQKDGRKRETKIWKSWIEADWNQRENTLAKIENTKIHTIGYE